MTPHKKKGKQHLMLELLYDRKHKRGSVATLALGSRPRQRLARGRDKRETREAHLILPEVQESVRE